MAAAKQAPVTSVVAREATPIGGNSAAAGQQEAAGEQPTPLQGPIASLLKKDGVVVNFSIDKDTKEFVVKVIDPFTNQVIRQIPPETFANLAGSLRQIAGILVDKQV
jgi:flagellar protein FlaG